jgi:Stress-activated map kinase interacting protein 1 (SIN1)
MIILLQMAMFDDPEFLVRHIRNSFITSDETGMCEMIIDTDDYPVTDQSSHVVSPPRLV